MAKMNGRKKHGTAPGTGPVGLTETTDVAATVGPLDPDLVTDPTPDTNGRVEAVWNALAACPGTSAVKIGAAAGISRAAASKILAELEAAGRAVRIPGGYDGGRRTPDAWHPADLNADATAAESDTTPVDTAETSADSSQAEKPAEDSPILAVAETDISGTNLHDTEEAASASGNEPDEVSAAMEPDPTTPSEAATRETSEDGAAESASPEADDAPGRTEEDDVAETGPEMPPGWAEARQALLDLAELAFGTVEAAEHGDFAGALGRLELLYGNAAHARRDAKAVLTGTTRRSKHTGSVVMRPGQLRDRVLAHLQAHPGVAFTPYEIGRVLGNSSGAVANALDRLVALGHAELTSEKPRKYALAS